MTEIEISNLRLSATIGTTEAERRSAQEVLVTVAMTLKDCRACQSDDLADTVDYSALAERIADSVENSSYQLLEKLAAAVLDMVMAEPLIQAASVKIAKGGALSQADTVAVTCTSD